MAKIEQELHPFQTPNFVRLVVPPRPRQDGLQESASIPLREVPENVLLQMCEDFKAEVLRKHRTPDTRQMGRDLANREI